MMKRRYRPKKHKKKIACSPGKEVRLSNTRTMEGPCCVRTKYTAIGAFLQE